MSGLEVYEGPEWKPFDLERRRAVPASLAYHDFGHVAMVEAVVRGKLGRFNTRLEAGERLRVRLFGYTLEYAGRLGLTAEARETAGLLLHRFIGDYGPPRTDAQARILAAAAVYEAALAHGIPVTEWDLERAAGIPLVDPMATNGVGPFSRVYRWFKRYAARLSRYTPPRSWRGLAGAYAARAAGGDPVILEPALRILEALPPRWHPSHVAAAAVYTIARLLRGESQEAVAKRAGLKDTTLRRGFQNIRSVVDEIELVIE